MAMKETQAKLQALQTAMGSRNADLQHCAKLLAELKIALTTFPAMRGAPTLTPDVVQQLTLAREVYEAGALLSIQQEDPEAFERHMSQLKTYYFDCAPHLRPSPKQNVVLALNLMGLLAFNRVAEFHTELELIPVKLRANEYIAYVLRLEQYLMEGSYGKITSSSRPPDPAFDFFLSTLMVTVRDEIAACSERAYKHLSVPEARKLLSFATDADLVQFAEGRQWVIRNGVIHFGTVEEETPSMDQVPSMGLVRRSLNYAKELEQIV